MKIAVTRRTGHQQQDPLVMLNSSLRYGQGMGTGMGFALLK